MSTSKIPRPKRGHASLDERIRELIEAAQSARDWLQDAPEGSDQWERGQALDLAIRNVAEY